MTMPTPHLEKLHAVLANEKLPAPDKPRLREAIDRYHEWIGDLASLRNGCDGDLLQNMVRLLNEYKTYIDVNLIFDSSENFLYRQKGQLKLDNSIVEEFLPWVVQSPLVTGLSDDVTVGPNRCFSAVYFVSGVINPGKGGDIRIRSKDQDFTVCRRIYVRTSYDRGFSLFSQADTYLAYIAAEIKTNLDKTMFQEACATAHDVKSAVAGAKFFLICEWLDMTPLSTAATDIDEALILRGSRRIASSTRRHFADAPGRRKYRSRYVDFLAERPLRHDVFQRLIDRICDACNSEEPVEEDVLRDGFF